MYLRWMVRKDNIDTGIWNFISPSELIMPLDTHIFKISKELGFTERKTPSIKTAAEITGMLRNFSETDPV